MSGSMGLERRRVRVLAFQYLEELTNSNDRPRIKKGLRTGELLVPGEHWPTFVYEGYNYDKENPWTGLFKSAILVCVSP